MTFDLCLEPLMRHFHVKLASQSDHGQTTVDRVRLLRNKDGDFPSMSEISVTKYLWKARTRRSKVEVCTLFNR